MNSTNWRTKRADPIVQKEYGELYQNNEFSPHQSSWRGQNGNPEMQALYRGGANPSRGRFTQPTSRPPVPIVRDPLADQAIDEGRRLYVGNLPYDATLTDIRGLFADISHSIQDISMSVDPMTGRNPSYCFVDFVTKGAAEKAMQHYAGITFMNRPLKVKPGVKQGTGIGRYHIKGRPSGSHEQQSANSSNQSNQSVGSGPYAFNRWRRMDVQIDPDEINISAVNEGRRLYVGGLPRFPSQATTNQEIHDLFKGYNVEIIGKMCSPHKSKKEDPGNHYYCFVDLRTKEEAEEAAAELDGIEKWNWKIIVGPSYDRSAKLQERQRVYLYGLPRYNGEDGERLLQNEVKELLEPYGVVKMISRIFTRPPRKEGSASENRCYCFVEFAKIEEADAAVRALSGSENWCGTITLRASKHRGALEEHFDHS
jgi:RNA recognition motif-containing protein